MNSDLIILTKISPSILNETIESISGMINDLSDLMISNDFEQSDYYVYCFLQSSIKNLRILKKNNEQNINVKF